MAGYLNGSYLTGSWPKLEYGTEPRNWDRNHTTLASPTTGTEFTTNTLMGSWQDATDHNLNKAEDTEVHLGSRLLDLQQDLGTRHRLC